jgi:hypothetical protein
MIRRVVAMIRGVVVMIRRADATSRGIGPFITTLFGFARLVCTR